MMSPFALRKGRRFGFAALLRRTADIRPEEITLVFWCWIYIFCVLSSYYVMRPIREQMGVAGGVANLPWLLTATLAGMLVANLPFALLVQRLPRSRFVPLVYRFFGRRSDPRDPLALPSRGQRLPAALCDHLDISLFPAGRHRHRQLLGSGVADSVLRHTGSLREYRDAGDPAFRDRACSWNGRHRG